jgi:hypothetical protein
MAQTTTKTNAGRVNSSRVNPKANMEMAQQAVASARVISEMSIPDDLDFSTRLGRTAPYKGLLETLRSAGPGKVVVLDEAKVRYPIAARAKKMGLAAEFAIHNGKLYVRLTGQAAGVPNGAAAPPAKLHAAAGSR